MIGKTTAFILLAGTLLLSSCVPWPNQRVDVEGVRGQVVDARTNQPIANALVKVSHSQPGSRKPIYHEERLTNSRGRYRVTPEGPWAWGYFIGPISGPVFGLKPDLGAREPARVSAMEVSAEGYRTWRWRLKELLDRSQPPEMIPLER